MAGEEREEVRDRQTDTAFLTEHSVIHLITSHSPELKTKMPGRMDILFQHVIPIVSEVPASTTTKCPEVRYCLVTLKAKSGWKMPCLRIRCQCSNRLRGFGTERFCLKAA